MTAEREKKILGAAVSIGTFLILQTCGAVWWASSVNTSLGFLKEQAIKRDMALDAMKQNRYTSSDAVRDLGVLSQRDNRFEVRLDKMEDKVEACLRKCPK